MATLGPLPMTAAVTCNDSPGPARHARPERFVDQPTAPGPDVQGPRRNAGRLFLLSIFPPGQAPLGMGPAIWSQPSLSSACRLDARFFCREASGFDHFHRLTTAG